MERSPLHQQVDTLPDLVRQMVPKLDTAVKDALSPGLCQGLERVFVTGCGDSHHAAVESELAFEQLAGLPCEPMTAMQFGRYAAGFLPDTGRGNNLLLAVSVSGQVSRTVEALEMGRQAGAIGVGVTGNRSSPLAEVAELLLVTAVPPLPDELQGMIIPGARSYIASQLALYLTAIHIGQERDHLSFDQASRLREEIAGMAGLMEQTLGMSEAVVEETSESWGDADQFLFCGSGPNYGTALFSAAKLLEASGDVAIAQELEEWAHLQYFGRQKDTPTILISAGGRDESRAIEIAEAAGHIGRRVAVIAPADCRLAQSPFAGILFPVSWIWGRA